MTTERASEIASRLTAAFLERSKEHEYLQLPPSERREAFCQYGEAIAAMYKAIFSIVIESRE